MSDRFPIIEGAYLRDILAQPAALRATLAGLECDGPLATAAAHAQHGGFDRIVLSAMGGSYWALMALHLDLLGRGLPSLPMETAELIYYAPALLHGKTLLIVNSQSGRSVEMLRMMEMKQADCFTIAVTNTEDSPLARMADAAIVTRAGEEATVSCKTWVSAAMALKWVADALAGRDLEQSRDELAQAAPAVEAYLRNWREHAQSAAAEMDGVRNYFLLGRGASMAAVGTGGLITKESTRLHSEAMTSAAFRHGPFEMIDGSLYALVFEGDPAVAALNRKMADDIVHAGGRAGFVSRTAGKHLFRLPDIPESLQPIAEILPVEMFTLGLAARNGREAGRFERATKVTTEE